jgi:hypothetical protein
MTKTTDARKRVTAWAGKARQATAKRDAAICSMRAGGATLREIGEAAGLAHTEVAMILLLAA